MLLKKKKGLAKLGRTVRMVSVYAKDAFEIRLHKLDSRKEDPDPLELLGYEAFSSCLIFTYGN